MKHIAIAFLIVVTCLISCNDESDVDDDTPKISPRNVRYELTGNFSGNIVTATFTDEFGGTITEEVTSFPWNKEITFGENVGGAMMVVSGAGGIAGQQVTLTIKKGGNPFGTPTTARADSGGTFTLSSPVIIF